jgi:Ca2+-binding RTX toxin-like protein
MIDKTTRTRGGLAVAACGLTLLAMPAAVAATIAGTAGNDVLRGTAQGDTIHGYAGNDDIRPGRGNDLVYGGRGNDDIWLDGAWENDLSGSDRGYGGPGRDKTTAGRGDVARLGAGDDWGWNERGGTIYGGSGRDVLWAYGPGRLHGGPGPDLICGSENSYLYPGATFHYWLGTGNDRAFGDPENGMSPCYEEPDEGTDIVWAGRGDDQLRFVVGGRDEVYAGPGNDSIRVRNKEHRVVVCGPGRDVLTLVAGAKPDVIRGCERIERE